MGDVEGRDTVIDDGDVNNKKSRAWDEKGRVQCGVRWDDECHAGRKEGDVVVKCSD